MATLDAQVFMTTPGGAYFISNIIGRPYVRYVGICTVPSGRHYYAIGALNLHIMLIIHGAYGDDCRLLMLSMGAVNKQMRTAYRLIIIGNGRT